jgi:hypothetical protein
MSDEKAETNRDIGVLYFSAVVDAQGYPNGMPYWHEMNSSDQYHYAVTGLSFICDLERAGYITLNKPLGLSDNAVWGEGDCKALMDVLDAHRDSDRKRFEERLEQIRIRFEKPPAT